jgi:hypothetical protein
MLLDFLDNYTDLYSFYINIYTHPSYYLLNLNRPIFFIFLNYFLELDLKIEFLRRKI